MNCDAHWLKDANISKLIQEYGTPVYVYSEETIQAQVRYLQQLLKDTNYKICYAVKANSNLSILALLKELGCGFDIVSEGELRRVLKIGGNPKDIVFAGVGKTRSELEYAIRNQIGMINVESPAELDAIIKISSDLQLPARISLRINPDIDVHTHPYLSTGLYENKFGIPIQDVKGLWSRIADASLVQLVGISCHIGSHVSDPTPLLDAYSQVLEIAQSFDSFGADIENIDFGGGFAVKYAPDEKVLDMEQLGSALSSLLKECSYTLIIEPGKFLTSHAGALLTEVLYTKNNLGREFAVVDAGMNDLIRPPLYQAHHELLLFRDGKQVQQESLVTQTVVGPVCETGCFFAKSRKLPRVQSGDTIAILNAGAYCFSMASNYNTRKLPAEVLIKRNGSIELIGKRQEHEEIWARELLL